MSKEYKPGYKDPEFALQNSYGEQACYFNSVIQAFWNMPQLQLAFISFSDLPAEKDHPFIAELKSFF